MGLMKELKAIDGEVLYTNPNTSLEVRKIALKPGRIETGASE